MNVLQINGYESPGYRFNGLSIKNLLKDHGINSKHLIWEKDTNNPEVLTFDGYFNRKINNFIGRIEEKLSLQSMLFLNYRKLVKMNAFKKADLVHLHIIHSGYLNIRDIPNIASNKPTLWTLHDPWALTGHCIYPPDNCSRWISGCGSCPDLKTQFPLRRDTTHFLFNYKKKNYSKSNFELIVASKFMKDMVSKSPMFSGKRIHLIPFGVDLDFFSSAWKKRARSRFSIPENAIAIAFRAIENDFKGFSQIKNALKNIKSSHPIYLLTTNTKGLLNEFSDRFNIVDIGWTNDQELLRDYLAASDIFLMPSIHEAFGLMAIEAMACNVPVIVFEGTGTALPEVIFSSQTGLSVKNDNSNSLGKKIQFLIDKPIERKKLGAKVREIVEKNYDQKLYVSRLAEVYKKAISK